MSQEEEQALERAFEHGNRLLQKQIGYNPTRWRQMVGRHGAVGAAKELLKGGSNTTSEGFTKLWEHGKLDMSVEWLVLVHSTLFTDDEREVAYRRLEAHDVPVDAWLLERLERRYP